MAIPTSKGRENFDSFSEQMRIYAKLHRFESAFESDSYVEVGAEGSDRAFDGPGSDSLYVRETIDGVGVSLSSFTDHSRPSYFSPE